MGRITAFGLGKRPASVRRLEPIELWVPARAVLALLLALEAVRTRVCSHTSGTDGRLLGMATRAANVGEQMRISSKLRGEGLAVRVQAVAEEKHVDPALLAETDEQGFGGPKDCSSKYSQ